MLNSAGVGIAACLRCLRWTQPGCQKNYSPPPRRVHRTNFGGSAVFSTEILPVRRKVDRNLWTSGFRDDPARGAESLTYPADPIEDRGPYQPSSRHVTPTRTTARRHAPSLPSSNTERAVTARLPSEATGSPGRDHRAGSLRLHPWRRVSRFLVRSLHRSAHPATRSPTCRSGSAIRTRANVMSVGFPDGPLAGVRPRLWQKERDRMLWKRNQGTTGIDRIPLVSLKTVRGNPLFVAG